MRTMILSGAETLSTFDLESRHELRVVSATFERDAALMTMLEIGSSTKVRISELRVSTVGAEAWSRVSVRLDIF